MKGNQDGPPAMGIRSSVGTGDPVIVSSCGEDCTDRTRRNPTAAAYKHYQAAFGAAACALLKLWQRVWKVGRLVHLGGWLLHRACQRVASAGDVACTSQRSRRASTRPVRPSQLQMHKWPR